MFAYIDPNPLGSASIGQVHKAKLLDGKVVIVKVVKPGNRELLKRDTILLNLLGRFLQIFLERLQPKRAIDEFSEYTLRELDLTREADNAETFAANFRDMPDVVFPKIFREFSGRDVLCMEFLDGYKPTAAATQELDQEQRSHLLDLGAASIIRMLYRDGFFHADLHPGNLMILPGPKVGFIDLGMVGRFTEELKRSLMYYYYCLVMGDSENAARYLSMVAQPGRRGDVVGFRKEVEEICRRWAKTVELQEYLARPPDPALGGAGGALRHVLPGRNGADGQGTGDFRGRRPDPQSRLRRQRGLAEARQRRSSSTSSRPSAWRRRACAAPRSSSTRWSKARCSSPTACALLESGATRRRPRIPSPA